jgi:hypothetical protein
MYRLLSVNSSREVDGITNGVGITSFFVGEGIKYIGGGQISLHCEKLP